MSTAVLLAEAFRTAREHDTQVDEIAAALLNYTDKYVAQWEAMEVPELDIENVIDEAALFRDRYRVAAGLAGEA